MKEVTEPTTRAISLVEITTADLRDVGLTPRQIFRLQNLRDCLRHYPHIEFFANDQWRQLLFMKWRYDHGEYGQDRPPTSGPDSEGLQMLQSLVDIPRQD